LQKHLVEQWTDGSKTHVLLGADPEHAYSLARILVDIHAELVGIEKDESEWYKLPDREITLPYHHMMTQGPVKCNLKQTMSILTSNVDLEEFVKKPFVVEFWDQIKLMADQPGPVDIWKEDTFKELREGVIRKILIHPIHQQQSEMMVQAAALVAQTNVDEDRRTNRVISITNIVRPANQYALSTRNAQLWDEGKEEINQCQGSHKVGSSLDYIDQFRQRAR
jgi:hypothetical protein